MKQRLTAIAAAIVTLLPVASFGGYVIHLKDGAKFITDQYVEEGDQIKFKRYGGIVGIEKDRILEIKEIEALPGKKERPFETGTPAAVVETEKKREKTQEQAPGSDAPKSDRAGRGENITGKGREPEKGMPTEVSEEPKKTGQEKADNMQAFLDEKRRIMREMERATSAFNEAKASKDKEKKDQYWNELLALQKKFAELQERVTAEHGGEAPAWWSSD